MSLSLIKKLIYLLFFICNFFLFRFNIFLLIFHVTWKTIFNMEMYINQPAKIISGNFPPLKLLSYWMKNHQQKILKKIWKNKNKKYERNQNYVSFFGLDDKRYSNPRASPVPKLNKYVLYLVYKSIFNGLCIEIKFLPY